MSKLQEIALAIKNCGAYSPDWQGGDEDLLIMARAAVEAMREPTEYMITEAWEHRQYGDDCSFGPDPDDCWRAMIDAILNEKPE